MAVLIYHAFPHVLVGGFVGVDIFFVISGFVIMRGNLDAVKSGNFSWPDFYARRAKRLLPALAVVLISSTVAAWFLLLPADLERFAKHLLAAVLFVPNWQFWSEAGYFDPASHMKPLLHLWSLGIEEQFYIGWPMVVLALGRSRWFVPALLVVTFASFTYSVYAVHADPLAAFYSPLSRVWELAVGCLLAVYLHRRANESLSVFLRHAMALAGALLIIAGLFLLREGDSFPGARALVPVVGTALLIGAEGSWLNRTVLTNRFAVYIGLISYPLYLWHWPLLSFAAIMNGGPVSPIVGAVLLAVGFVLAALTYDMLERPVARNFAPRWVIGSVASSMAAIGVGALLLYGFGGVPGRFPQDIQEVLAFGKYEYAKDARFPECWLTNDAPLSDAAAECAPPKRPEKVRVAIWGDSHAARLYPGLSAVLGASADVAQYTRNSCPPILDAIRPGCSTGNADVIEQIRRDPPDVILLYAAWANYSDTWEAGSPLASKFSSTLSQLQRIGVRKIVVLGPAPKFMPSLPELVVSHWLQSGKSLLPDRVTEGLSTLVQDVDQRIDEVAKQHDAVFISAYNYLCAPRGGGLTHALGSKSDLVSWDYGHFTTAGATMMARHVVATLIHMGAIPQ